MTLRELQDHSDKRDDILEGKLDKIDYFLNNGLSEKIIKGITDYLDKQMAKRVRLFCKVFITAVIVTLVSCGLKLLFF